MKAVRGIPLCNFESNLIRGESRLLCQVRNSIIFTSHESIWMARGASTWAVEISNLIASNEYNRVNSERRWGGRY